MDILKKGKGKLEEDDYKHMKQVNAYCARHLKQVRGDAVPASACCGGCNLLACRATPRTRSTASGATRS